MKICTIRAIVFYVFIMHFMQTLVAVPGGGNPATTTPPAATPDAKSTTPTPTATPTTSAATPAAPAANSTPAPTPAATPTPAPAATPTPPTPTPASPPATQPNSSTSSTPDTPAAPVSAPVEKLLTTIYIQNNFTEDGTLNQITFLTSGNTSPVVKNNLSIKVSALNPVYNKGSVTAFDLTSQGDKQSFNGVQSITIDKDTITFDSPANGLSANNPIKITQKDGKWVLGQ